MSSMMMQEISVEDAKTRLAFPVERQEVRASMDGNLIKVPDRVAIVRPDTKQVLSVMSEKYTLLKHLDMFEEAAHHLEEAGFEYKVTKCELINDGARALVGFFLPELTYQFPDGDIIDYHLYFKNSYDGSWAFDFTAGFFRLVCSNGLVVGEITSRIHRKHSPNFVINPYVQQIMEYVNRSKEVGVDTFMNMKRSKISVGRGIEIIGKSIEKKIWPKKYQEEVEENFIQRKDSISNDSLFDVYNAYTRSLRDMRKGTEDDISFQRVESLNNNVFTYCRNQLVA